MTVFNLFKVKKRFSIQYIDYSDPPYYQQLCCIGDLHQICFPLTLHEIESTAFNRLLLFV